LTAAATGEGGPQCAIRPEFHLPIMMWAGLVNEGQGDPGGVHSIPYRMHPG